MASLIVKADIEGELQITLAAGYTDPIITGICTWADSMLKLRTNRTAFSGLSADIAKYAELCLAIDRLATSNRDLVKVAISSISENGANITFSNGKNLESYRMDAERNIGDLKIPGAQKFDLIVSDPEKIHSSNDKGLFY